MPPRRQHRDPGSAPVIKNPQQPPARDLTSKGYVYIEAAQSKPVVREPEVDRRSLSVSLSTSPP